MRVLIVGGGAAGLCCAIRLRQLDPALQVTVLERLINLVITKGLSRLGGNYLLPATAGAI